MVSRAQHRREMLLRLGGAALSLMEANGPGVTVDAIAERAGVSRRTVFRYVELKEELLYVNAILWLDIFDDVTAANVGKPAATRLREAGRALARHIDDDPDQVRRAFMVAAAHPDLAKGFTAVFQRWAERVAAEVLAGLEQPSSADRFRSRIVGASVMGTIDAVIREWLILGREASVVDLLEEAYLVLDPLLDQLDP